MTIQLTATGANISLQLYHLPHFLLESRNKICPADIVGGTFSGNGAAESVRGLC